MIYINSTPYPEATADEAAVLLSDQPETLLVLSLPATAHDDLRATLDSATEIVDEQARTISRYTPRICYDVADMDGRTYAKLRISDKSTGDNPAYYQAESDEMLSLLGEAAEIEYQRLLEGISNV